LGQKDGRKSKRSCTCPNVPLFFLVVIFHAKVGKAINVEGYEKKKKDAA
jgi:hypothetical protein